MNHAEMVALIRAGVDSPGGLWADFGAGGGNFTRALRELVGPEAVIYAIDRDRHALRGQRDAIPVAGDFTQPLDLPSLDGILMANALHWVSDQARVMAQSTSYLRSGGRLIIVEYDVTGPRSYVPHPVPYARFEALAQAAGLRDVRRIGERVSPSSGVTMYAGVAQKGP